MFLTKRCPACGVSGPAPCPVCHTKLRRAVLPAPPRPLTAWWALLAYGDVARELVVATKYRNHRDAVKWMGRGMAALLPSTPAAVTWAPTTPDRVAQRGFDHAEILARHVARRFGVTPTRMLRRSDGNHQTGHGAADRMQGPDVAAVGHLPAGTIVVVDDVITTGSTMRRAAEALLDAGADDVWAVAATYQSLCR